MARARENERCALRFPQTGKKISGGKNISDPTYFREREREREEGEYRVTARLQQAKGVCEKKDRVEKKETTTSLRFP